MGWLFSERWLTKAALVKHLTTGNGVKTLKHCAVGNNLWCVHEHDRGPGYMPIRYICLYKMQRHGSGYDGWGYKDIDETAGPNETTCPVSYLEFCTAPEGRYAYFWRQEVYARHNKLRAMQPGKQVKYGEVVYEVIKRVQGGGFKVKSPNGTEFRMKPCQMAHAEVL